MNFMNLTHFLRVLFISTLASGSILGCSHPSSPSIPLPQPSRQPSPSNVTPTFFGPSHSRSLSGHYTWVRTEMRDPNTQQLISIFHATDVRLTQISEEPHHDEQLRIRALGTQYPSIVLDFTSDTLTLNTLNGSSSLYRVQYDNDQINRLHIETLENQNYASTQDATEHETTTVTFFIRDRQLHIQRSPVSRRGIHPSQIEIREPIYAQLTYVFDFENE